MVTSLLPRPLLVFEALYPLLTAFRIYSVSMQWNLAELPFSKVIKQEYYIMT